MLKQFLKAAKNRKSLTVGNMGNESMRRETEQKRLERAAQLLTIDLLLQEMNVGQVVKCKGKGLQT